jgi:hypothetical protein
VIGGTNDAPRMRLDLLGDCLDCGVVEHQSGWQGNTQVVLQDRYQLSGIPAGGGWGFRGCRTALIRATSARL